MDVFKGYRTLIVNFAMMLPMLWDVVWQIAQSPEFRAVIPEEYLTFYALLMVAVNMYLRKITTTPIGRKE